MLVSEVDINWYCNRSMFEQFKSKQVMSKIGHSKDIEILFQGQCQSFEPSN